MCRPLYSTMRRLPAQKRDRGTKHRRSAGAGDSRQVPDYGGQSTLASQAKAAPFHPVGAGPSSAVLAMYQQGSRAASSQQRPL